MPGKRLDTGLVDAVETRAWSDSEIQLQAVIENLPYMVFVKSAGDLSFVRINRAAEELLGYSRQELVGKTDYDFFPKAEADFFTEKDREVIAKGEVLDIPQEPIETRQGHRILHTKKIPVYGPDGTAAFLLGISEDITERKHQEEQLRQSEQRLRALMAAIPDEFIRVAADGRVVYYKKAGEPEGADAASVALTQVVSPAIAPRLARDIAEVLEHRRPATHQYFHDESGRCTEARLVVSWGDEVWVILRDVTDQVRTYNLQREFVRGVLAAQEEERKRLARELHDETSQRLASMAMGLGAIAASESLEEAVRDAKRLQHIVSSTIEGIRHMQQGWHPYALDELGLADAVRAYADHLYRGKRIDIRLALEGCDSPQSLPIRTATAAYRIVQEALNNAVRHAQAHSVDVRISRSRDHLKIRVEDNGRGFSVGRMDDPGRPGLGLYGLRERAALLGGVTRIESAPGKGTTVNATLPLPEISV